MLHLSGMEITFSELSEKFLNWCKAHQEPRTHEWYAGYLLKFNSHPGVASTAAMRLKPYQVVEWIDSYGDRWGGTYRGGAIVAVKRVFNWGEELGYVDGNPIKKLKKPPAKRREIYMTPDDFESIKALVPVCDPFHDLLTFIWHTGCRPQEVRNIEPRHVELEKERIVFPAEESKGKRTKRIIYLHGESLSIIKKLMERGREGKLFRNKRAQPWTKYAICNRFHRISQVIGKRMFAYAGRHGFATRKLIQGHDHIVVACLLGHTDGSMLAKVYQHVDQDTAHLKKALADPVIAT